MKKLILVGGLLLLVLILVIPLTIYFLNRSETVKKTSGPNPTEEYQKFMNDKTVTKIFRGVFPCSDCDGAETVISLSRQEEAEQSGVFTMAITYLGTDKDVKLNSGKWDIQQSSGKADSLLVLSFSDGTSQSYKWIDDETLVMLGNESESLNEEEYTLKLQ